MSQPLADAVAAADPSLVRARRPRGADVQVAGPLRLLDALDLGDGHAVGIVVAGDGSRWTVPLVTAGGRLRRSRPGDGTAERLVALLGRGRPAASRFAVTSWHHADARGERGVAADQTNESVIVGERAVVKWAVHLPPAGEPGSPAPRRIRTLVGTGFGSTPRPWGVVEHDGTLLATVVDFLPGALDGWDWAVADVRRLAAGETGMDQALAAPKRLGGVTASMHVSLATTGREGASAADAQTWARRAAADLDEAVRTVGGDEGERLRRRAPALARSFGAFVGTAGTPLIDVHGDLHVGQVLRHGSPPEYAVTDFDGNPVLPEAERGRRQPAAVDVAGMVASLDHVGRVVLHRTDDIDATVVRSWITQAQQAFLHDYRDTLARRGSADLFDERLLEPMRLAQEVREYLYAVQHLPHWVYVPDLALADLLPDEV